MRKWGGLAAICTLYFVLASLTAYRLTPTVDEYAHLPAGVEYWQRGQFDLYSKNPPLGKLWLALPLLFEPSVTAPPVEVTPLGWGPWLYGAQFELQNHETYFEEFFLARQMNIVLALGSTFFIYLWAMDFGASAVVATFVSAVFLLSPTILAHGSLATVDLACCFTILVFCFYLSRIRGRTSMPNVLIASAILGLALATKFTALLLIPWLFIFLILEKIALKDRVLRFAASIVILVVTINVAYAFHETLLPLPEMISHGGQAFAKLVPGWLVVPLPRAFISGFDAQLADTETGEFGSYLFGRWSNQGWWYYNFAAFALKESPILLCALGFALIQAFISTIKNGLSSKYFQLWIPFFCIAVPMTFANRLQIGIRYLIPLYPFLSLFLVPAFQRINSRALCGFTVLAAAVAVTAFPDYLSYFNPGAWALNRPEELLLDSNYDWGQDLYRLKDINAEAKGPIELLYFGHVSPKDYGIDFRILPANPVKGLIAVSANFLMGAEYVMPAPAPSPPGSFVQIARDQAQWLRSLKPLRQEGSIFIYDTRQ